MLFVSCQFRLYFEIANVYLTSILCFLYNRNELEWISSSIMLSKLAVLSLRKEWCKQQYCQETNNVQGGKGAPSKWAFQAINLTDHYVFGKKWTRNASDWIDIWLGCCMRANSMYEISSNQPTLVACPGLMWCATGLRFYYIGDTDPESKLAIGIGHLWSWAGFMAAHIWAINFAINYELHQYSGDNNEPICCPKCSFKLIWPYLVSCYPLMTQFRPLRQPVITL